jgi:uncharacterized protein (TIGR02186 family)
MVPNLPRRFTFTALVVAAAVAAAGVAAKESNPVAAAKPGYRLEADVSMHAIPVDVRFSGARVVIFGSVDTTGPAPEVSAPLDVVAVVEAPRSELTVRRKSWVSGIWINTKSVVFEHAPTFYAVVATRALELVAPKAVLLENRIGLEQVPISTVLGDPDAAKPGLADEFRSNAIALGMRQKRYVREDDGINFVGANLFRGQIDLPASIPLGLLTVNVYLFEGGKLVGRYDSKVNLQREGVENFIYEFAHRQSLLYGIFTVALAGGVGLAASFLVGLRGR